MEESDPPTGPDDSVVGETPHSPEVLWGSRPRAPATSRGARLSDTLSARPAAVLGIGLPGTAVIGWRVSAGQRASRQECCGV